MARIHRRTHPTFGIVSWNELVKKIYEHRKTIDNKKICRWCLVEVTGRKETCCGSDNCSGKLRGLFSWASTSWGIIHRDGAKCVACGVDSARASLEVDHIIPVILGGTGDDENLRTLCSGCHKKETTRLRKEKHAFVATTA